MKTFQLISKAYYILFFLFFASVYTYAQEWRSGWVYIENVKTGLVLDVQHDVKENGTNVWPFKLNYGRAQMFRFNERNIPERYGEDARYIIAYNNHKLNTDFYLSVKTPPLVIKDNDAKVPSNSGATKPELVLTPTSQVVASDKPNSNKKPLRNFVFSIEAKREVNTSNIAIVNEFSTSSVEAHKQIWNIIPVPGEADTYYIQSAHFGDKMVIEPLDFNSGGTLVLSSFSGTDIQKWKISKTRAPEATNLKLSNFRWEEDYIQSPWYKPWKWHFVQTIKGKLSWTKSNALDLTKQRITIESESTSNYDAIELDANKSSYVFNIKSTKLLKTEKHCFKVRVYSKWAEENVSTSASLCENPDFEEEGPIITTPPTVVSKLLVRNCHNGRKSVRLWTYDHTVNDGQWEDHGTLNSQWQESGCRVVSPKKINLSDNHVYTFVAIDCGNSPPNESQASCRKYTSPQIRGNADGTSLPIDIS